MSETDAAAQKALRLLGLARRAGAVAPGTDSVRRAIREGRAELIVMAEDASSVQMEKIRTTMHDRSIPQAILGDRARLGAAIGLSGVSALAITERSLAERLAAELQGSADGRGTNEVEA